MRYLCEGTASAGDLLKARADALVMADMGVIFSSSSRATTAQKTAVTGVATPGNCAQRFGRLSRVHSEQIYLLDDKNKVLAHHDLSVVLLGSYPERDCSQRQAGRRRGAPDQAVYAYRSASARELVAGRRSQAADDLASVTAIQPPLDAIAPL